MDATCPLRVGIQLWVAVPKNYAKLPIQRIVVATFVLEVVGLVPECKAQWHCPEHSRHLMVREIKPTECECTRKYPKPNTGFPAVATPPGGAAPPAGPREFAEEAE